MGTAEKNDGKPKNNLRKQNTSRKTRRWGGPGGGRGREGGRGARWLRKM